MIVVVLMASGKRHEFDIPVTVYDTLMHGFCGQHRDTTVHVFPTVAISLKYVESISGVVE